jgi:hypothetical protein
VSIASARGKRNTIPKYQFRSGPATSVRVERDLGAYSQLGACRPWMDKSFAVANPLLPPSAAPTATTGHPHRRRRFAAPRNAAVGGESPTRFPKSPRDGDTYRGASSHAATWVTRTWAGTEDTTRANKNKIERGRCCCANEWEKEREREKKEVVYEPDVRKRKSVSDALSSIFKDVSIRFVAQLDELG